MTRFRGYIFRSKGWAEWADGPVESCACVFDSFLVNFGPGAVKSKCGENVNAAQGIEGAARQGPSKRGRGYLRGCSGEGESLDWPGQKWPGGRWGLTTSCLGNCCPSGGVCRLHGRTQSSFVGRASRFYLVLGTWRIEVAFACRCCP